MLQSLNSRSCDYFEEKGAFLERYDINTHLFTDLQPEKQAKTTTKFQASWIDVHSIGESTNNQLRRERIETAEELGFAAAKSSENFQVFFIPQRRTFLRLSVSRELFQALLEEYSVFDRFKELVLSFGAKRREDDVGPPPFRFRVDRSKRDPHQFECAYGLRYVEENDKGDNKDPWSIRQSAVYHQHAEGTKLDTWILIAASESAKRRIDDYASHACQIHTNPFELHLVILDTSIANWRWYIAELTEKTTAQSERVLLAEVGRGPLAGIIDFEINFVDRQQLKQMEDKVLDVMIIFDSTLDTITNLLEQYKAWCATRSVIGDYDNIANGFQEQCREISLNRKKIETLHQRLKGTASLLSDLLDYENAKIAHKNGLALQDISREAREENKVMRILTEKATRDAAAVKVITVITIIFLPTTVVGNFFSTQFVHLADDLDGGTHLSVSSDAWIFAAAAVPLTMLTIFIWYAWVNWPIFPFRLHKKQLEVLEKTAIHFSDEPAQNQMLPQFSRAIEIRKRLTG